MSHMESSPSEASTGTPGDERFSRDTGPDGAADQVKQQAQQGADKAKGALRSQIDERSTTAGQQLSTHAGNARTVAGELRKQGQDGPAKLAEQAAERTERLGGYLQDRDADTLLQDAEQYARENPWVVVAGGLAAGFVASRFLKASSSQRSTAGTNGNGSAPRAELPQPPRATPPPTADLTGGGVGTTSVPGRPVA